VVQGEADPFGMPAGSATCKVVAVPGNHSLATDLDAVAVAVRDWLPTVDLSLPTARGAFRSASDPSTAGG
jgi:hypothetical protein